MTATPIEGPAPVVWFLTARDSGSSLRITPGLTLREDAAGRLKLGAGDDDPGWIRFDIEGDALWVTVVSPRFTLASATRRLGDRMRLDESLELVLPSSVFHFSRSLTDRPRARRSEIRLVGIDASDHQPAPIRLLPAVAEAVPAPPAEAVRSNPPRRRAPSRRARPSKSRRWRLLAAVAGAVTLLIALHPASPLGDLALSYDRLLAPASALSLQEPPPDSPAAQAAATPPPLIASVEAMLTEAGPEGPSEAVLQFAIEAYRLAVHEQPGNTTLRQRLDQLEAQLRRSQR